MASTRARVSHGGRGSRPAKNMLYSASSRFSSASSVWISRSISEGGSATHYCAIRRTAKPLAEASLVAVPLQKMVEIDSAAKVRTCDGRMPR